MERTHLRIAGEASLLLVVIALIAHVDHLTGSELGLSLFYVVPVALAGWRLGRVAAVLCAIAAAFAWAIADVSTSRELSIWNAMTRLMAFTFVGLALAVIRMQNRELTRLLEREASLSRTDPVTGLPNARAFRERLETDVERVRRSGAPICLAYVDLDEFKRVNDGWGHHTGDRVLREVADVLRSSVRAADCCARVGGDEFAVLLVDVRPEGAEIIARRIVEQVNGAAASYPGSELGASVGLVYVEQPPKDPDELVRAADEAMYRAKREGKGRVVVHRSPDTVH